jgi:NAD(P)-dependent dehydrogenase (short-subunit alcohol dehydrogenase family)
VKLFTLDVSDESAAASALRTAIDAFGSLDVVINNAGYGNLSSIEDTPMSDFRAQIETQNLLYPHLRNYKYRMRRPNRGRLTKQRTA